MSADPRLLAALAALEAVREVLAATIDEAPTVAVRPDVALLLKFDEAATVAGMSRTATFQAVGRGDLLAVMTAGAYGFAMSSNYNSRTRVPEILVSGRKAYVIRRRETFEDLIRGEAIPDDML